MHIDNFLYDFEISDKDEVVLSFKIDGVEHTLGVTEKDAKAFVHLFQMKNMSNA